jgi:hypothetical protein
MTVISSIDARCVVVDAKSSVEEEVVVHMRNRDLQLMDYRWVSTCLAIEHKCLRDFVSKRSVKVTRWPSKGKACCDKVHDCHPNFDYDYVHEWFDRQDKEVVVIEPLQQAVILVSSQDTLVD